MSMDIVLYLYKVRKIYNSAECCLLAECNIINNDY